MTSPLQFPSINPGQVINDPGTGGIIAQGLAAVLAHQQQQKENEFRLQQLQEEQARQQALAQYYQGTLGVQNRELDYKTSALSQEQAGRRQVGGAMQAALGVGQPQPTGQPAQPTSQPGAFSQVLQGGGQAIAPGMQQIFGGVQPENMGAAVEGVQNAQKLQPKPEEPPTSGKEFEFVQHLAQMDPSGRTAKFFMDNWVNKGPQTVVNNNQAKAESAFGVEMAKGDVAAQEESFKAANTAASAFPSLNEAYGLFKKGTVIAGLGAKQVLGINRVLATMGMQVPKDKVADTQTVTKLLRDGVLAQLQTRALGSGTAVSDADRAYMEQVQGADLTQQPDAIKRIIRINVGLGVERMVSAKMLLEQQIQDHPDSKNVLAGKIKLIETKLKPVWKSYQEMLAEEAKNQADQRMQVVPLGNSLFPARTQ